MSYRVVHFFTDLSDNSYAYHTGDFFPREGVTVSEDRLKELSTSSNRMGIPLIEYISEVSPLPEEPREDAEPVKGPSKPRKPRKGKKNTNE